MNDSLTLMPVKQVHGTVVVPGSKSLSNRALLLAALAEGDTLLTNLLDSEDIRHMLNALTALGIETQWDNQANTCWVKGSGGAFTHSPQSPLFLGNAGTAMRPLCAVLAASPIAAQLTGEPRMLERPIGDLVDALRQAGADITYTGSPGFPPLAIQPSQFIGGELSVDGSVSSQFLTALLMAAPLATTDVTIHIKGNLVSKPYIDITLDSMAKFGVTVVNHAYQRFDVKAGQKYRSPGTFLVEGDASSASYFLAAAAIKGGTVTVQGVGNSSIQGDIRFADVLAAMGANVTMQDTSITVSGNPLQGVDMDMNHIPDAAMTIATTALFASTPTTIRNVYNWRVKETDRLHAMATELKKVGATVEEGHDYIKIWPCAQFIHASIDTYNDHRMAMCFALLNLGPVGITINDPGCTAKTFPDFFTRYQTLCHA